MQCFLKCSLKNFSNCSFLEVIFQGFLPSSVPVCSSVPVELGVGFTFPSNNNNNNKKNKNPHLISQLLLTRFWPNFKSRYLKTSRTDFSCHGDICPGNISPGDICPYQQYLSSNWLDSDQTLKVGSWEHLEQIPAVEVMLELLLELRLS